MAEGKKLTVQASDLDLAGVTIPLEWLVGAAPIDSNAKGIVLASERVKCLIMIDGRPVEHMVTFYAQRAALSEDETLAVAKVAAERKAKAAERAEADQKLREREIKRAVELTKDVAFEAMGRATADAQKAAAAIETLKGFGVKVGGA